MAQSKGKKQQKICTEYSPSMSKDEEAKIKQAILTGDNTKASALRAAFLKSNVWNTGTTINVIFMGTENLENIDIYDRNRYNEDEITGPYDDLQLVYWDEQDNGTLDIPSAIEQIIKERIEPLVNLTFNFDTTTNYNKNTLAVDSGFDNQDTIIISFELEGAWSHVGKSVNSLGAKQEWTNIQGWPSGIKNPSDGSDISDYKQDTFIFDESDGEDAVKNYCIQVLESFGLGEEELKEALALASNIKADENGSAYYGATMNFGWFDVPTVIHEFGHALGMIHEHQNPYGTEIQWNLTELYSTYGDNPNYWSEEQTYQQVVEKYSQNEINGSTFDPCSIMLYFFDADLTTNGVGSKQNMRMSPTDMQWLAQEYEGKKTLDEVKEFYNSIYNLTDDDLDFDTKLADCNALAATFGESQPITSSSGMVSGENTRNIIIGLLVVLIVALLLK